MAALWLKATFWKETERFPKQNKDLDILRDSSVSRPTPECRKMALGVGLSFGASGDIF